MRLLAVVVLVVVVCGDPIIPSSLAPVTIMKNDDHDTLLAPVLLDETIMTLYVDLGRDKKHPIDEAECYWDDGTLVDLNMLEKNC